LNVSYFRGEKPSVENLETIEEVLEVIKSIANHERAEIYLINGKPLSYYANGDVQEKVKSFEEKYDAFIEKESIKYFEEFLEPIMIQNKWFISYSNIGLPILIAKDEDGEWDNIPNDDKEFDFEYLCYSFASVYSSKCEIHLKGENSRSIEGFRPFFYCLSTDYFENKGYIADHQ
jgi:hypothetical protein